MLKDKSGQDPSNLEITATKTSVTLYCQTMGKEDTKISEAPARLSASRPPSNTFGDNVIRG